MTEESTTGFGPEVLESNHVFSGLAHPRRRYLLYALQQDTSWTLEDLIVQIAAWESEAADTQPPDDLVEAVHISLYHTHIPKLVDDDVVEFDETSGRVTTGPNAEQAMGILENTGRSTDSRLESHARSTSNEGRI